jgi:hypothetical protein
VTAHSCLCHTSQQPDTININFLRIHRDAEALPHTIWLDNFSKIYSKKMPNLTAGAYALCHWTCKAVRTSSVEFDITVMTDDDGNRIPAMPDDLFGEEQNLLAKMDGLADVFPLDYYSESAVIKWKVFNVPPRPDPTLAPIQYFQGLRSRQDTVKGKHFIPAGIIKLNINSNEDLCRIMRLHYEKKNMHRTNALECQTYSVFNTDMAIFHRILKVN